jgi:hypothetical protein
MLRTASLLLVILLSLLRGASAQDSTRSHLLLLSWPPEFYLSDAESEIIRETHKSPEEYRAYFRKALDLKIAAELENLAPVHALLQDTSAQRELEKFYYGNAYTYEEPVGPRIEQKGEAPPRELLPHFKNRETAQQSFSGHSDARCMQVDIRDRQGFDALMQKYNARLLVCINQFEIRTHYNTCLDIARKVYRRELMIHYSIHDRNGRILRANFASAYFPSDSNRDTEIAERVFPEIAVKLRTQAAESIGIREARKP